MFSKEFMRYLINYQPDGYEVKKVESTKEIEFKLPSSGKLAKAYLAINSR